MNNLVFFLNNGFWGIIRSIFLIGISIVGVGSLLLGIVAFYSNIQVQSWPSINASVYSAGVKSVIVNTAGSYPNNEYGYTSLEYCQNITYSFIVNSKQYITNKLLFDSPVCYNNESAAQSSLSSISIGQKQIIYYSPADPENIVLSRSGNGVIGPFMIIFGLIFIGIAVLFRGAKIRTKPMNQIPPQ